MNHYLQITTSQKKDQTQITIVAAEEMEIIQSEDRKTIKVLIEDEKPMPNADRILKQLYKYKEIGYEELLQLNFRHCSKEEFDEIITNLILLGVIERTYENNKTTLYHKDYKKGGS